MFKRIGAISNTEPGLFGDSEIGRLRNLSRLRNRGRVEKHWRYARSDTPKERKNQMSKIVRFHKLGGPEVLKIEDVPSREPAKGEVSLSVQAIGLNRAESMFMHGHYLELPKFPAT